MHLVKAVRLHRRGLLEAIFQAVFLLQPRTQTYAWFLVVQLGLRFQLTEQCLCLVVNEA